MRCNSQLCAFVALMGQAIGLHSSPWWWRNRIDERSSSPTEVVDCVATELPVASASSSEDCPLFVAEIFADSAALRVYERRERELAHGWCYSHMSPNVYLKDDDPLTIHRTPVAQSTDGARAKRGFSRGVHVFEFTWPTEQRGTHAAIGKPHFRFLPLFCVFVPHREYRVQEKRSRKKMNDTRKCERANVSIAGTWYTRYTALLARA